MLFYKISSHLILLHLFVISPYPLQKYIIITPIQALVGPTDEKPEAYLGTVSKFYF